MRNENYALITGASDGFGKALALECAARDLNVILVALPGSGLAHVAAYIERNYGVKALHFEHDLSKKEECYKIFEEISRQQLSINILINNAGMGGTHFFDERDTEFYYRQIELNVVAPTLLTHLFLTNLQQHNPAYILNVSSLAGIFCLPKKQVYGGTKSYLVSFSKSLRRELKRKNVSVSVVCPGGMNTNPVLTLSNFNLKGLNRWSIMNPEEAATITIDNMFRRREIIIPGKWNRFFMLLDKLIPEFIRVWLTGRVTNGKKIYTSPVTPLISPLKTAV